MNDKSLECIRFYDIQVNKMVKGRGGVILFTDRGCRLFLECSRNDGFYVRDEAVTKSMRSHSQDNMSDMWNAEKKVFGKITAMSFMYF